MPKRPKSKGAKGKIGSGAKAYRLGRGKRAYEVRGLTDDDVDSLMRVEDHTKEVLAELDTVVMRALEAIGIEAEGDVKELTPVNTGRLRNSITHTIDADGPFAVVGTNVEYSVAVEFNEKATHVNGQAHYLHDGVNNNLDKYRRIFERMMKGA